MTLVTRVLVTTLGARCWVDAPPSRTSPVAGAAGWKGCGRRIGASGREPSSGFVSHPPPLSTLIGRSRMCAFVVT